MRSLRNFLCRCKSLKPRRSESRCSLCIGRDINLTALRYAASVMLIGLLALCHTVVRRWFSCTVYRFVVARRGSNAWCFVPRQCGADPVARASLQRLRGAGPAASATWWRQCESDCSRFVILPHGAGFWLRDIPLRIGAAQSKFNHSPLLNGREILSSGRGA